MGATEDAAMRPFQAQPHQQSGPRRQPDAQARADSSIDHLQFRPMEDYTSRYKGEAVEIALFGGEYQDGILTAYCLIEDVAHVELNGHILVPLQNVASLHCTSRCDAQDDWPPRGLFDDEREDRDGDDDGA
jgi:hypothetical protein